MISIRTRVVYVFGEGALPSRFTYQEESLVVVYNRIMACFGPSAQKMYCKTSGAKLRSAIELSRLKWSDDSDSVSPLGEFILVGCQLIQQFPVSFSRKPLSNMISCCFGRKERKRYGKTKKHVGGGGCGSGFERKTYTEHRGREEEIY